MGQAPRPTLIVVLLPLLLAAPADAEPTRGILLLRDPGHGPEQAAPLLETEVELRITGPLARARVRQRFRNPSAHWLEARYSFPLPDDAAVDALRVRVGGRVFEGRIAERARARAAYARARGEGRRASLVEQERPNLFSTALANVGPGEEVEVEIGYQELLAFEAGEWRLRFPLRAAPRYDPGGAEPAPPAGTPDAVRLVATLDAGVALRAVRCDSHAVRIRRLDAGRQEVVLETRAADRDFQLRWTPRRGSEPVAAVFSEERDGELYVLLMLLPPEAEPATAPLARELVLVIDTSGSMGGESIRQARAALSFALDRLRPGDRFDVIRFDSTTRRLFGATRLADPDALEAAHRYVAGLEAEGGTEMRPALEAALADGPFAHAVRQVVFVTDGSVANERELFGVIASRLGRSRLFTVGIGSAPNAYFLHRAARSGRGTTTFVSRAGEVTARMEELFARLERPALTDLSVHWNDEVEMWPDRPPDLYAGEPLVLTARLRRFVGEVRVSGRRGERPFEAALPLVPGRAEAGIARLWARRKISALMDELGTGGDRERLRAEVTRLALAYGLVSRFTSLVAVDVTPVRPRSAPLARVAAGGAAAGVLGADVLPRTATPGPLLAGLGLTLLAAGVFLRLHLGGSR